MTIEVDVFRIPSLTKEEIIAVQSVYDGVANEGQQRMALETIITKICMTGFTSYKEGSFDGSAFLAGRSYVGARIMKTIKTKSGDLPSE